MSSTLFHNASLLSFHKGFNSEAYDAMFVEGNTIKAIGRLDELQSLVNTATEVIDATGKTIMPGFNDTHIHIWKVGSLKTYTLDVRNAGSLDEVLQMLSDYAKQYPDAAWINARGFNEAGWKDGRLPNKNDLDSIITDRPVYLLRTCAHIAACNSKAIEIAGISSNTPVPQGGTIGIGNDGKPNGIFAETALGLVTKHIPGYTKEQLKKMVLAAREEMYRYGITAATDPAVDPLLLQAYHELNDDRQLHFRLCAMPFVIPDGGSEIYPLPDYFRSDFLDVHTVKFFSDGGLSGKTAALKKQYKNSTDQGVLRLNKAQYQQLCNEAMQKNFSIATHAIGDAAIELVVDVYKQLHASFPHLQNRIEHLGLPEKKHLHDMAANNIAVSLQTIFIYELGKNFRKYLTDDYLDHCYPARSVIDHGIHLALSSDAPVVKNFNPWQGIATAFDRKDAEGNTIAPNESINLQQALKAYTSTPASLCKTNRYGSLEEGKLADFIVLDKNPFDAQSLTDIKVEKTFVDGKLVWQINA
jgi:predicted amidohydrolase YtcJ